MTRQRLFLLLMAFCLIGICWWGVVVARAELVVRSLYREGVPLLYVTPQTQQKIPGVLVAHGFAGSKQLMLGYAHVLAHAGYGVMLWDFGGHGINRIPLEKDSLQKYIDIATGALLEQPEIDPSRLALVGHSMGSGAVMSAAIRDNNRYTATVAISPTSAEVTSSSPANLQLQAGSNEGVFVANAEKLLKQAGGENQNFVDKKARSLVIVPNADHISILFSNYSHQSVKNWLNATFRLTDNSQYIDRRMSWYILHLLTWLFILAVAAPMLKKLLPHKPYKLSAIKTWGGLAIVPVITPIGLILINLAIGILKWFNLIQVEMQNIGGFLLSGVLGIWFFIAGTVWLGIIRRLPRPKINSLLMGLLLFGVLWVAFGAIADRVWLQWLLITPRFILWLLLSFACLPWFLASGLVQQNTGIFQRFVWWLAQNLAIISGLLVAIYFLPQLGFLLMLLPIFPIIIALLSFVAAQVDDAWSYALGSTLFFAWIIAAVFPLVG